MLADQGDVGILREDDIDGVGAVDRRALPRKDLRRRQGGGIDAVGNPDMILGDEPHEDEGKRRNHQEGGGVQHPVHKPHQPGLQLFRSPEIDDQRRALQDRQRQIGCLQKAQPHLGDVIDGIGQQGQQGHRHQPDAGQTFAEAHLPVLLSRFCCSSSRRITLKESNCASTLASSRSTPFRHSTAGENPRVLLHAKSSR